MGQQAVWEPATPVGENGGARGVGNGSARTFAEHLWEPPVFRYCQPQDFVWRLVNLWLRSVSFRQDSFLSEKDDMRCRTSRVKRSLILIFKLISLISFVIVIVVMIFHKKERFVYCWRWKDSESTTPINKIFPSSGNAGYIIFSVKCPCEAEPGR